MWPQTPWAKSHQSWIQEPGRPFWMESLWELQKEWMLMIQWWPRLWKKYISKSGKLLFWLEPPKHMWTYMWLTGWLPNREDPILKTVIKWISNWKVQDMKHLLWDDAKTEGEENYPSRAEEADTLPRSPLPLPHTNWQTGRRFVVCSVHRTLSSHHEWMSPECWTPGSAVNSVLATWLILVTQNGHTDAEGDQQLWAMHPAWRHSF